MTIVRAPAGRVALVDAHLNVAALVRVREQLMGRERTLFAVRLAADEPAQAIRARWTLAGLPRPPLLDVRDLLDGGGAADVPAEVAAVRLCRAATRLRMRGMAVDAVVAHEPAWAAARGFALLGPDTLAGADQRAFAAFVAPPARAGWRRSSTCSLDRPASRATSSSSTSTTRSRAGACCPSSTARASGCMRSGTSSRTTSAAARSSRRSCRPPRVGSRCGCSSIRCTVGTARSRAKPAARAARGCVRDRGARLEPHRALPEPAGAQAAGPSQAGDRGRGPRHRERAEPRALLLPGLRGGSPGAVVELGRRAVVRRERVARRPRGGRARRGVPRGLDAGRRRSVCGGCGGAPRRHERAGRRARGAGRRARARGLPDAHRGRARAHRRGQQLPAAPRAAGARCSPRWRAGSTSRCSSATCGRSMGRMCRSRAARTGRWGTRWCALASTCWWRPAPMSAS